MLRPCTPADTDQILDVINDGAQAYRGVIPDDCWHDPYMALSDLQRELDAGVRFWCVEDAGRIDAVMGIQDVLDVALVRHAYTRTAGQGKGVGSRLLAHLRQATDRRILIGTWAAASWAIRFYEGRGFALVTPAEKERLLKRYWTVSDRQIAESVVLARQERALARQERALHSSAS
jgi:GNAT superfamily N-acetyltransferase